ncbi:peptidase E [Patescibacteria group bacterium]|nr:peptidase E [Patescibacteria group bacterium]
MTPIIKKIVALGGGEIGRPGYPVETTKIDREIIRLTGKKNPRLLFIPTASNDSESYYEVVKKHFGKRLKTRTDVLYLLKNRPTKKEIKEKVLRSDIIYVGGGNTEKMMHAWKRYGLDKILYEAWERGIVLSGLSAGSICWFKWGHSDSRKMLDKKADYIRTAGLGMIEALHCPHWDVEKKLREKSLKNMIKKTHDTAIVIDNCAALEIVGDSWRVINSKTKANAYKIYWRKNKLIEEKIQKKPNFTRFTRLPTSHVSVDSIY